ncbi:hypothetical protein D3C76_1666940 [compost metagenome]
MVNIRMRGEDLYRNAILIIAEEIHIMVSDGKPAIEINVYLFHSGPTPNTVKLL